MLFDEGAADPGERRQAAGAIRPIAGVGRHTRRGRSEIYRSEPVSRSLAKAVTWRFTATIDTFVISYIVTGKVVIAGTIAATEIFTKILIYYFHERAWALIPWGRRDRAFQGRG